MSVVLRRDIQYSWRGGTRWDSDKCWETLDVRIREEPMDTPHESDGNEMEGEPASRQEVSAALARESARTLARSHWVKDDHGFLSS